LAALAHLFANRSQVGDGELGRALQGLQREHFVPPDLTQGQGPFHKAALK
jgi:hypothetical protein